MAVEIILAVPYVTDSGSEGCRYYVGHPPRPGSDEDAIMSGAVGKVKVCPEGQVVAYFTPPRTVDQRISGEPPQLQHLGYMESVRRGVQAIQDAWKRHEDGRAD